MSRLLLTCLLILSACSPPADIWTSKNIARVEIFHVVEFGQRYDIRLEEASATYNPLISSLSLRYLSEEIFDLCQARDMLVELVDSLVEAINDDPIVLNELANPPISPYDLDIIISFDTFMGEFIDLQYVSQVRFKDGQVTYYAFSAFSDEDYFEKHTEPYETAQINSYAYRSAKQQISNMPREINKKVSSNPPVANRFEGPLVDMSSQFPNPPPALVPPPSDQEATDLNQASKEQPFLTVPEAPLQPPPPPAQVFPKPSNPLRTEEINSPVIQRTYPVTSPPVATPSGDVSPQPVETPSKQLSKPQVLNPFLNP